MDTDTEYLDESLFAGRHGIPWQDDMQFYSTQAKAALNAARYRDEDAPPSPRDVRAPLVCAARAQNGPTLIHKKKRLSLSTSL